LLEARRNEPAPFPWNGSEGGTIMIRALFGSSTTPYILRKGLDAAMDAHRAIAGKVAGEVNASDQATAQGKAGAPADPSTLGDDMAALADVQMRYEAEAQLLHLTYQNLRASIRTNG
jgi:hypothetical protein